MTEHIKIGAVPPRRHYIADGTQRAFAYPFPIFASEDMQVHLDAALQTGGYTVSGSGMTAGGTVTFDLAPDEGVQVTLLRRLPYERVTDFLESGALPARSLNDEYDYLTACVQQLADDALMMLRYAPTDLPASSLLPGRAARANQLLAFDGSGNPTVTPAIDSEGLSSYVGPGAGAVRRSIRDKLADIASVRDFGAVGDGIADDTLAIQTALTAATAVFVPPGDIQGHRDLAGRVRAELLRVGGGVDHPGGWRRLPGDPAAGQLRQPAPSADRAGDGGDQADGAGRAVRAERRP